MKKILIIEDEKPLREEIAEWLNFEGFQAIVADDGIKGFDLIRTNHPDLILCDIMMPGLDGYSLIAKLRESPVDYNTPVIMMSALSERKNIRKGMSMGADDYLTKPFTRAELFQAIQARLKGSERQTETTAEALSDLKYRILSTLPHELKTPLNGIIGFGEMLYDTPELFNKEDLMEIGISLKTSGLRLSRLVQNFLAFLSLEYSDEKKWNNEEINADQIYALLMNEISTASSSYDRDGDISLDIEPANLLISREFIQKIAFELLDNACKFSGKGTPVKVTGKKTVNGLYKLDFCDRGRGMHPNQLEEIGSFIQFDRKYYEQQGMGLGLALVGKMVQLSGGSFTIENAAEEGICVSLILKLSEGDI